MESLEAPTKVKHHRSLFREIILSFGSHLGFQEWLFGIFKITMFVWRYIQFGIVDSEQ